MHALPYWVSVAPSDGTSALWLQFMGLVMGGIGTVCLTQQAYTRMIPKIQLAGRRFIAPVFKPVTSPALPNLSGSPVRATS